MKEKIKLPVCKCMEGARGVTDANILTCFKNSNSNRQGVILGEGLLCWGVGYVLFQTIS